VERKRQRVVGRVGILVVARILHIFVASKAAAFVLSGLTAHLATHLSR
jgi:small neutral amino acid transporter SnatA (MarC family)